jgi:hypothetical protein
MQSIEQKVINRIDEEDVSYDNSKINLQNWLFLVGLAILRLITIGTAESQNTQQLQLLMSL